MLGHMEKLAREIGMDEKVFRHEAELTNKKTLKPRILSLSCRDCANALGKKILVKFPVQNADF
jgi:hypothetical protein